MRIIRNVSMILAGIVLAIAPILEIYGYCNLQATAIVMGSLICIIVITDAKLDRTGE